MPVNKNQHFVPRVHLKPFTLNQEGAAIKLFNVKSRSFITDTPVKNQCSKDYFYGKSDVLENAIRALEGAYGNALKNIQINKTSVSAEDLHTLKLFWLFQSYRTESAVAKISIVHEFFDKYSDEKARTKKEIFQEAVKHACEMFCENMFMMDSKKSCVVVNDSGTEFVTSDHPAIMTNRFHFERKRNDSRSFSIGKKGAIGFLPLTPKLAFLVFDGTTYKVPHSQGILKVKDLSDVQAINAHQFINCNNNIYVSESCGELNLLRDFNKFAYLRDKTGVRIKQYDVVQFEKEVKKYNAKIIEPTPDDAAGGIHVRTLYADPGIWPKQLKIR